MKIKHFFLFVLLSLVLSLSVISCGGSTNPGGSSQTPYTPVEAKDPVELDDTLTAMKLAKAMECGWNLGNTLDARTSWTAESKVFPFNEGLTSETVWGEVSTTKAIIETGIKNGYKTIRIPVTWCNHLTDTNYTIDPAWMNRVKQIVNWAYDAGYYVILNEHHSVHDDMTSPLKKCEGYIVTTESAAESKAFLKAIWAQICQNFNDEYDEHLIFETMNEPRDTAHEHCWNTQPDTCDVCKAEVALVNEYNQLILNTIRESGGNNANRFVMVPAMGTGINEALKDGFKLPEDSASDRLIVTGHRYPLDSGGTGTGSHHFDSNTKNEITYNTRSLYSKFVSKGIPVVIGEFGAARVGYTSDGKKISDFVITAQDRLDCFSYFAQQAGKYSMPFINWDCGGDNGMATINRKTCSIYEPEYLAAVIKAWKDGNASAQNAESLIESEEISLDGLGVWDAEESSFDKNTKVLTLSADWSKGGANIWFGDKIISDFKTIEISYKKATSDFRFWISYAEDPEGTEYEPFILKASDDLTTKTINLDTSKKMKMIFFQCQGTAVSITLEKIILKP